MGAEQDVRAWLGRSGAETIKHPGGTLLAHLSRVHDRLVELGLGAEVQLAGLAHAAYGTDGFDVALLDRTDRTVLRDLIGEPAEDLVYLYGGCDRGQTWRRLAETGDIVDRFTGLVETPGPARLRHFVDLSIVNELDVIERDPAVADTYGEYFRTLFASWAGVASPPVTGAVHGVLGR